MRFESAGFVKFNNIGPRRWQLWYRNPHTGEQIRRQFSGFSCREMREMAEHINEQVKADRDYIPGR